MTKADAMVSIAQCLIRAETDKPSLPQIIGALDKTFTLFPDALHIERATALGELRRRYCLDYA